MNCNKCSVRLVWGVVEVLTCPKCNDIFRELVNKPDSLPKDNGSQTEEE